ncbi:MAG: hypothetical protein RR060_04895, partial [Victivallaceae bacterium]
MNKKNFLSIGAAVICGLSGCESASQYVDASDTTVAVKNLDTMSSSDWVIISQEAGTALLSSPQFAQFLSDYAIDAQNEIQAQIDAG